MGLAEAARLASVLLDDPSSRLGAAAAGLKEPATLEARVIADLWDLVMGAAAGKKAVPYKRPWQPEKTRPARTVKPTSPLTVDDFHSRWRQLTTKE